MRKTLLTTLFTICYLAIGHSLFAQVDEFVRIDSILVPEVENCGFGEIVAGVDFDGDGKVEIYAVNNMHDIGGNELIPRIYKYELTDGNWELVWDEYSRDIVQQNSWAGVTHGDWDADGKQEIIWAPANNFTEGNENPPRILVWEQNDGDKLGKANFGFETPNIQWTITEENNFEVRPVRILLNDVDNDGKEELIFADRRINYHFGVISVSDVPIKKGDTVTWTLEASGLGSTMTETQAYDVAVLNNTIYLIHEDGSITPIKYADGTYTILDNIKDVFPGGSWKSSNVVDLDNDGTKEIIVGGWLDGPGQNKVYLLQEDETLGIKGTQIANFEPLIGESGRINGGHDAFGDIDNDGNLDFIFGTRGSEPTVAIIRLEYQGGDITDSLNYQKSIIDSLYPVANPGRYDIVSVANLDDDPELEVLYTDGNLCERFPIVILDLKKPVAVRDNKELPTDFALEQNYPNPFNPTTTIQYTIPTSQLVQLRIYNVLGKEVATLVNQNQSPGSYKIEFNSSKLSSGTYIYTLKTNYGSISKKMIVMK
jgi:hypothetical protein